MVKRDHRALGALRQGDAPAEADINLRVVPGRSA